MTDCDCGHDLDEDHYDIPGGLAGVCRKFSCMSSGQPNYAPIEVTEKDFKQYN